jgi:hypothetical protein
VGRVGRGGRERDGGSEGEIVVGFGEGGVDGDLVASEEGLELVEVGEEEGDQEAFLIGVEGVVDGLGVGLGAVCEQGVTGGGEGGVEDGEGGQLRGGAEQDVGRKGELDHATSASAEVT